VNNCTTENAAKTILILPFALNLMLDHGTIKQHYRYFTCYKNLYCANLSAVVNQIEQRVFWPLISKSKPNQQNSQTSSH